MKDFLPVSLIVEVCIGLRTWEFFSMSSEVFGYPQVWLGDVYKKSNRTVSENKNLMP